MMQRERLEELRRHRDAGVGISEIARQLDLDRKTVRKWGRQATGSPTSGRRGATHC
jgi:transposase-like protein